MSDLEEPAIPETRKVNAHLQEITAYMNLLRYFSAAGMCLCSQSGPIDDNNWYPIDKDSMDVIYDYLEIDKTKFAEENRAHREYLEKKHQADLRDGQQGESEFHPLWPPE